MQVRFYIIFPVWLILVLPFISTAQVNFTTLADKQSIGLTDILQVQFIAENASQIEAFQAPPFTDFNVLQGPIETSGMSLVNGEISRYLAMTFILRPKRTGKLMIQGASALINGKRMKSNQLRIDVGDAKATPANPYPIDPGISAYRRQIQEDYILQPGETPAEKIKKGLLVVLDLDKTTAYVGEPIVSTYKLLTRLRSDSRVSKRPSMNGFSVYDMVEPDGAGPTIEERDGKEYQSHIIRKTQLFPLQEGKFELEPVELENNVRFLRTDHTAGPTNRSSLQRLIDDMMGDASGSWEEHRITIASPPRTITILPLPEGAPGSFSGAVGKFTIKGTASTSKMAAGENLTYILEIEGSGNLPLINAPDWLLPDSITSFDPQITEELNKTISPMEGKKTITYTITSSTPGTFQIPGIEFSYFDPAAKAYKTLRTDSINLTVTPSLNRKPAEPATQKHTEPVLSPGKLAIIAIGLLLFGAMTWLILSRKKTVQAIESQAPSEPEAVKPEPVQRTVADYLSPARWAAAKGEPVLFFKELENSIWNCIADRFELTPSERKKETVIPILKARRWSDADLAAFETIWNRCEWALYAPGLAVADSSVILADVERLLNKVQQT
jgi:hypothetical protein